MMFSEEMIRKMLPKTYSRKHVAREVFIAITHFDTLVPIVDKYVYSDGTAKNLMSLTGTLPVIYNDKTYNIPVCTWIEESYPQTAPICYVRPTREMLIVKGKYVSSNGEVELPYLEEWNKRKCNLVTLLQVMVAMFGEFPPLCMRPFSELEQASCRHQYQRQTDVFSNADGSLYINILGEDNRPFQQHNETNC
ncbi:tumor susceptibility gene 101 protein isoform X1 [Cynoglossus semilaevis]|uniref:Zgc:123278 n=1 Tax=Cynoglossus semilaevis TaxID=244447 RepID=A0A3P8VD17_CYNSE|nr:GTPase HRas isoform X1 [Cynoglossus semilaevis]